MNINLSLPFGIRIVRGTTAAPEPEIVGYDRKRMGETQQLAIMQIQGTARKQTTTMEKIERSAHRLTKLVLWVSIPHQMGYIMDKTILSWGSPTESLHSLSALLAAVGMPFVCDILTLLAVMLVGAPVAQKWARIGGFLLMIPSVIGSSLINYNAGAAASEIRWMFCLMVLAIPIAQGIRALAQWINWARMLEMENKVAEQVGISATLPTPAPAGKTCPVGCTCGKHAPKVRKTAAAKPASTRKPRTKTTAAKPTTPTTPPLKLDAPMIDLLEKAAQITAATRKISQSA